MSKANPRKAMAALLPTPIGDVKPMTLAMYAALERIESPLVTGVEPKDTAALLPSLYLLTHGAAEIFRGNLVALAFAWADTVPVSTMNEIRAACERQLDAVRDVIPEEEPKKARASAATTDGSPRSSTTSRSDTTGRSVKSSGKSRSRRSPSSDARKPCTRTRSSLSAK